MSPSVTEPQGVADTQTTTFSDRLSVNGVPARRSKAPKIGRGLAAHSSSDMFKSPGYGKPRAKRWDHRLNVESNLRKLSPLKVAARYLCTPGLISLGGGLPSSDYFPFEVLDVKVPRPPFFSEEATKEDGMMISAGKHDIAEGKSIFDMHVAFNYGQATGSAQLLRFITEHTEILHQPPYQDWQCTTSVGSTSALEIALRMFTTRGDYVLTEDYTFCSAIETAVPIGLKCVGIAMDSEGIIPSVLDSTLENWDPSVHDNAEKPWLLYTIPTGQNPTGATQSEHRRLEIYRVAQKHDLYIIEDEPYYYLQMPPYTGPLVPTAPRPSSHEEFLSQLVPSYVSMDSDGRVMRLETFSKVIAPGTRTGWIVASEQIVERFVRHSEVSVQNPSGISQLILFKLLDEAWGHGGYLEWLMHIRVEYTARRDNICNACQQWLPREITEWTAPMAGMFLWIRILWHKHPDASTKTALEIEEDIWQAGIASGVLLAKGSWSRAEPDVEPSVKDDIFFRMTFAASGSEAVQEAVKRFGKALRVAFALETAGDTGDGVRAISNGHA